MNGLLLATGPIFGLLRGFCCGLVLERAGFGGGCKLTAQFRLTDGSVFRVMVSAIVFAAVGIYVLELAGWVNPASIYVPAPYLWAIAVGGALIGGGFAVGGYCPGTSVVGLMTGRLDALVFFAGLLIGTFVFAGFFPQLDALTTAGELTQGDRLPEALGMPEWLVLAVLVAAAVGVFFLGGWFERRARRLGQA